MDHPNPGHEPEAVPPSDPADNPGDYVAPWTDPGAGLDYTIAAPPPPTAEQPAAPEGHSHLPIGIIAFLAAIVGALATVGILSVAGFFDTEAPEAQPLPTTAVVTTTAPPVTIVASPTDPEMVEAVWAKVSPSVVTVHVSDENGDVFGSGSGVVLGGGYVATNHHVVDGAEATQIILQDGRSYEAEIVASDSYTDLAVLSVDAAALDPIEIGSTDDLSIGQLTIAVGNPLGQSGGSSLTVGVLSALSRRVDFVDETTLFGMLQTDAPITNGSSGGALVDADGQLIGITAAIGVSEAGAEGIGYAIPVDVVQRVTDEIIETGTVRHAFLGILGGDYVETGTDGALIPAGAQIINVDPAEGSADRAGLLTDDVIVAMEGVEITTMNELVIQLRLYRVGETIDLDIIRAGEELTVPVTLDERPDGA